MSNSTNCTNLINLSTLNQDINDLTMNLTQFLIWLSERMGKKATHATVKALIGQGLPVHVTHWGPRPEKTFILSEVLAFYSTPRQYTVPGRYGTHQELIVSDAAKAAQAGPAEPETLSAPLPIETVTETPAALFTVDANEQFLESSVEEGTSAAPETPEGPVDGNEEKEGKAEEEAFDFEDNARTFGVGDDARVFGTNTMGMLD